MTGGVKRLVGGRTGGSGNRSSGLLLRIVGWAGLFALLCICFGAGFLWRVYRDSSSAFSRARGNLLVAGLRGHEPEATTTIYDGQGNVVARAFVHNRYPVTLDEISPFIVQGLIATEDKGFYGHSGISLRGVLRALWVDITTGARHGGSTITMQLARGLFLVPDQTIQRKIQEAFIAVEIERQFSKDEILEMYLNHVYFGAGAYGIEAASRTYFGGASASELTLSQSAMLVRMVKNPSGFNPERDPDRCRTQRNIALAMMAEDGFISDQQAMPRCRYLWKWTCPGRTWRASGTTSPSTSGVTSRLTTKPSSNTRRGPLP